MRIFSKIFEFSKSLFTADQNIPDTKLLMESTMEKVKSYESCLQDMNKLLQRQGGDIKLNQETNLELIGKLEAKCEESFSKFIARLECLENSKLSAQFERDSLRSCVASIQTKVDSLENKFHYLSDQFATLELNFDEQLHILQKAVDGNACDIKDLIAYVQEYGDNMQKHISNTQQFVSSLEMCFGKRESCETNVREQILVLDKEIHQLGKALDRIAGDGDGREREFATLSEQWGQFREEQFLQTQLLQDVVEENKQELAKAVEVITKINSLQMVSAPEGSEVREMKNDLLKATSRLAKLETHVKMYLAKLSKAVEGRSYAVKDDGGRNDVDYTDLQQRISEIENEVLYNLKQQVEELKKENSELAREVKHLKHARRSEKSANAELSKRLEVVENAANFTKIEMRRFQEALQTITSSLVTRLDEDIVIKKSLQESRKENDKKFEVVLGFIEPVMETINRKVGDRGEPIHSICSPLTKAAESWKNELENTLDEEVEKQTVMQKLTIEKANGDATGLSNAALLHFGDKLRLNLPAANESKIKCQTAAVASATRRVISKDPSEKGLAAVKCVADHAKYREYYSRVAPLSADAVQQQTNYIKKNINNTRKPGKSAAQSGAN
ncbi:Hypothetical predicted protein [Cloeon dipterum]|uniref:Uncharacterized protein n=1 Tax=Cloeon dipterum TaxID=197152 RepID=A0A8S1CYH9_9INSE|nr:Hypothetical predicted protein [Cloeon dipterum]